VQHSISLQVGSELIHNFWPGVCAYDYLRPVSCITRFGTDNNHMCGWHNYMSVLEGVQQSGAVLLIMLQTAHITYETCW
jgi:hypothetical protein